MRVSSELHLNTGDPTFSLNPFDEGKLRLNLGCGSSLMRSYVNVDWEVPANAGGRCFVQADVRHLPFKSSTFDEIYSSHLLEHLEFFELPAILAEWGRVLKEDGILKLVLPNALWYWKEFLKRGEDPKFFAQHFYANDRDYGYKGFRHRMMYTALSLTHLLEDNGWTVVDCNDGHSSLIVLAQKVQ